MTAAIRTWLEVSHHPSFRVGGWAFLRRDGGEVRGTAGGARRIDQEPACLTALVAALDDTPAGANVELLSSSPDLLALVGRIAAGEADGEPSKETLDLRGRAASALRRVPLVARTTERTPGGPAAFAAAWAELARDRAKNQGPFSAVIPRSNLAKAGL